MTAFDDFPISELPPYATPAKPAGLTGDALRMNPDHIKVTGYQERCASCKGRGRFISWSGRDCGPCFKCKGKGSRSFATAPEVRAAARDRAATAKDNAARELADRVNAFNAANPELVAYLAARADRWEFAASMRDAIVRFGSLTERQLAAVQNAMSRDKDRAAARTVAAPVADVAKVLGALETAKSNGLKFPKLRLASYTFSLAGALSANAGAVYVKSGSTYMGKVLDGRFHASRDCGDRAGEIIQLAANPAESAKVHGLQTGECSCCGRELTDPVSVARGIGPICAGKFGF